MDCESFVVSNSHELEYQEGTSINLLILSMTFTSTTERNTDELGHEDLSRTSW